VSGCTANNNIEGIQVNGSGTLVIGNNCSGNSFAGVCFYASVNCRVEDNHIAAAANSSYGITELGPCTGNVVIKNSAIGNYMDYYFPGSGNVIGPVITNTVSGIITNSNPWANFSF
jgi:parallel beta-helix repeat protein